MVSMALSFTPLSIDGAGEYRRLYSHCSRKSSYYSFGSLWAWRNIFGLSWAFEEGLCWIRTEKGQAAMGATFRGPIVPGYKNPDAKIDLTNVKMIDYNFTWAGENRARLLERYENDVRHKADAK